MDIGKSVVLPVILCAVLCGCARPGDIGQTGKAKAQPDVPYGKELEEIRKSLRGDIRIRLRRDGKGACSWEITGKDPQEIIRADAALGRRINGGKPE